MEKIDQNDFVRFVKSKDGQILKTLKRGKSFTVHVTDKDLVFTPQSTLKERIHRQKYIERVLDHFALTESYKLSDYKQITAHASYMLKLIEDYLSQNRT